MQYFDCITESGTAGSGSYSREGEMQIFMCISACGAYVGELLLNLRSRECNILIVFPQAEVSILDRIPTRGGM